MAVTLRELYNLPEGTILQKGTRQRIYRGANGFYIFYNTPTSRRTTAVIRSNFEKWLKGAEIVK